MKIDKDDDFGGTVLNCAVRYCLGRMSYMPGLVMDEIKPMLPDCTDKTLRCFERDILEYLTDTNTVPYQNEWVQFLVAVKDEIDKRKG